jgi:hypothetical protein
MKIECIYDILNRNYDKIKNSDFVNDIQKMEYTKSLMQHMEKKKAIIITCALLIYIKYFL